MRISDWSSDVCSSDLEGFAQAVFQVAQVGVRQFLRLGAEDREGRRAGLGLGGVLQAHRAAGARRRRMRGGHRVEPAVEVGGRSEERRSGEEWFKKCRARWST